MYFPYMNSNKSVTCMESMTCMGVLVILFLSDAKIKKKILSTSNEG